MNQILNFINSVSSSLCGHGSRNYPVYRGFSADAKNMSGDWKRVGNDMRKALKKEQQTRKRK